LLLNQNKMSKLWDQNIDEFIALANKHKVRMLMVGGGAVNFHGYQRHSADVDFWIETTDENFKKLVLVFNEMGYEIDDFPENVKKQEQNISIKFSPVDLDLELITKFSVNKSFEEAYNDSEETTVKANRAKDLLDIQQLREINKK
jgi:hypothetical protein